MELIFRAFVHYCRQTYLKYRQTNGQMYETEKIENGNQRALKEKTTIAKAILDEDIDIVKIMKITGLTEEDFLCLQDANVTV